MACGDARRHVCTSYKNVTYPLTTRQVFCKPTYKKYMVRCGNQWCEGVKLVYERYHKDTQIDYACCPGWAQVTYRSYGCNKPVCDHPCQNGGKCVKPNCCSCQPGYTGPYCETKITYYGNPGCMPSCQHGGTCLTNNICLCPPGYTGPTCETDVDECKTVKPCDQICYNTPGSYKCECKETFVLQNDGQTCRKEDDEGTTLEAKDLEFQRLDRRLSRLERMVAERQKTQASKKDIALIYEHIDKIANNIVDISDKLKRLDDYKEVTETLIQKLNLLPQKSTRFCECQQKKVSCERVCANKEK